jgi:Helix-turn-helix domain
MERRSERSDSPRSETIVDARTSLALWLRAGRAHRGMSLDDVAKVTKIQPRILERLEAGKLDGLPAEVFVRGFVRSFARCVGLDEEEALRRYAACGLGAAGSVELAPTVRALVEAMVDLAPGGLGGPGGPGGVTTPRATPRRMQAVEVVEPVGGTTSHEFASVVDLATGSLRDLPVSRATVETIVETMMLPETGTIVKPARSITSSAEAMTDSDADIAAEAADALPAAAATATAVAIPQDALGHVDSGSAASTEAVQVDASTSLVVPSASKKKRGRRGKGRSKRASESATPGLPRELCAVGTPAGASPVVTAPVTVEAGAPEPSVEVSAPVVPVVSVIPAVHDVPVAHDMPVVHDVPVMPEGQGALEEQGAPEATGTATWAPKMPPIATTPSVPWRRPAYAGSIAPSASTAAVVPSLVIDDADPESAERILEERAEKHAPRRSFLPPILLDREDRSARQGGLTLAVILLLIAATLTLSYLMRRPSAGGDGMTRLEAPARTVDSLAQG